MQSDRYSRLISWLKVLLPLMALALLSTLFLLSRSIDPESVIPFADKEIQARLRDQQVTGPFFSGTTVDGDQISFSAEKLTTPQGQVGANQAQEIEVELNLSNGGKIGLSALLANFDIAQDTAELTGSVIVTTSTGYRLTSELLTTKMSKLELNSPGPVDGDAPAGTLWAGSMTLNSGKDNKNTQLIFTNGVKLIYVPKQVKE